MGKDFEVGIVGGGPAGSTCGYELAKEGVDVAIFDHSHPREKPCGGAVSGKIFKEFDLPEDSYEKIINLLVLESPRGESIEIPCRGAGVVVMRERFDLRLYNKARENGAENINERVTNVRFKGGCWHIKTNKGSYRSQFLVGADGCPSLVRKTVAEPIPKKYLGHGVGYHIPHSKNHIEKDFSEALEIYFVGEPYVSAGYVWVFPKSEHVTIGIGSNLGTPKLKESLENFIKKHPGMERLVKPKELSLHSHLLPQADSPGFFDEKISGRRWALIGDAAGHVNPVTGEGIYYGMVGGKVLAECILKGRIEDFEDLWRGNFGGDLYWGARVKGLLYNSRMLNKMISLAQSKQSMRDLLADIVTARVDYDRLFKKRVFRYIKRIIF